MRHGIRMLRRNPGLTATAVLTLALGIRANTAIFSAVDTALCRQLPYRDPGQTVDIVEIQPPGTGDSHRGTPDRVGASVSG